MSRAFIGMSGFAACHPNFPSARFFQQYPKHFKKPGIAILSGTFGWATRTLLLYEGLFPGRIAIEVHISNGRGRRRIMHRGDFARGYDVRRFNQALESKERRLMRAIDRRIERILDTFPILLERRVSDFWCPELEDNLSDEAFHNFAERVARYRPRKRIVRNPCHGGDKWAGLKEWHGNCYANVAGIMNLDGTSIELPGTSFYFNCISLKRAENYIKRYRKKARMVSLWHHEQQGYYNVHGWGNPTPPRQRRFTVCTAALSAFPVLMKAR